MVNFKFDDITQLLDFISETKEFLDWEVITFRISSGSSAEINMNTKINDPMGIREYVDFKRIKNILFNYYEQNSYSTINLELRFKFPNTLRKTMDPLNSYSAFYVNFYCDTSLSYLNISFNENTIKTFSQEPMKSWAIYITNLYNTWYSKNLG